MQACLQLPRRSRICGREAKLRRSRAQSKCILLCRGVAVYVAVRPNCEEAERNASSHGIAGAQKTYSGHDGIMPESLMVSSRRKYLREDGLSGNKCNGYRPGRTCSHGRTLTFRIPWNIYGNLHLRMLATLRVQQECDRLRKSVILLMGKTDMSEKSYLRQMPEAILTRTCSRTNKNAHCQACQPMA